MFQAINTFNPVNRRGELAEMSGCHRVTEASAGSGSDHIWGRRSGLSLLQITKFAGITSERPPEGMSHPEMAFFSFILLPRFSFLFSFLVICCAGLVVVIARLCVQSCWPIRKDRSIIKHCFYPDCHLELKTVAVLMFEKLRWKLVIVIVMSATAIGVVYIISSHWSTAVEQFVLICFSSQIDSSFVSFDCISQTSSFDRSDDGYCLSRGRNHFFLLQFISWKNETWKCLFSSFWTGTSQIRHARPCETGFGEKKRTHLCTWLKCLFPGFSLNREKQKAVFD